MGLEMGVTRGGTFRFTCTGAGLGAGTSSSSSESAQSILCFARTAANSEPAPLYSLRLTDRTTLTGAFFSTGVTFRSCLCATACFNSLSTIVFYRSSQPSTIRIIATFPNCHSVHSPQLQRKTLFPTPYGSYLRPLSEREEECCLPINDQSISSGLPYLPFYTAHTLHRWIAPSPALPL